VQLQEALQAFLLQLAADGRSPHTIGQYRRHVTGLIHWLGANNRTVDAGDIAPATVAEFFATADAAKLSARGGAKKATSANAQRTSLRCFFRWVHESGIAPSNAARLLRRARCAPPPPRALHPDEEARLLEVLAAATGPEAERDRMLVRLLLGTGIRLGSAIALDIGDLDFAHGEITLRKTKNDRPAVVLMPKAIATALRRFVSANAPAAADHHRASGPVFLAGDRRISTRHAQRRLSGWMQAAGIVGKSAHALRHTFATRIYASTGDLQITQAALGHASIVSTCIYARMDRTCVRAAVGA
jgi:integrase/recombinase XerC